MGPSGGSCPHPDFMGHRFWGLPALPMQWSPNEIFKPFLPSVAFQLSCLHEKCGWESELPVQIFMAAELLPCGRELDKKGPLGADTDTHVLC